MYTDEIYKIMFGEDVVQNATGVANLDAGEIIVIGEGGTLLNGAAITALGDNDSFWFVRGKSGSDLSHLISGRMTKGDFTGKRAIKASYAAAIEQVSYIGDNSNINQSNGDITTSVANDTEYTIKVVFQYDPDLWSKRAEALTFAYTSSAAATAGEIADAFVAAMNANEAFARQAVAVKEVAGGGVGIKITGLALGFAPLDTPLQVKFKIALDKGWDTALGIDSYGYIKIPGQTATTTDSQSVSPTPGTGTYKLAFEYERQALGFNYGQTNQRKFPINGPERKARSAGNYNVYSLTFKDTHKSGDIVNGGITSSPQTLLIFNAVDTAVNGTTAAIEVLINAAAGVTV